MANLVNIEDKYQSRFNRTVADTLSDEPIARIAPVPETAEPKHRISVKNDNADIRLSFGLFYLVIKFGREQRSEERLAKERKMYPVLTWANMRAVFLAWTLIFVFGLAAQLIL